MDCRVKPGNDEVVGGRCARGIRRRSFLTLVAGAAAWPLAARAQQSALPVVAFIDGGSPVADAGNAVAFRNGLVEAGFVENQNLTIDYHWLEGRFDRLPTIMGDLVNRPAAVIAAASMPAALAAKAATQTIPIVFGVAEDPVHLGLVDSLARPAGNATGINWFAQEVAAKRLRLLHDLLPKAVRIGVLVNPANTSSAASTLHELQQAAPAIGVQLQTLHASTISEIDAVFAAFARERPDALFVAPDAFFTSRHAQFNILTARERIPAAYSNSGVVEAGGLMSYGTNVADMMHQVGVYTGRILKGAKPSELPVLQSTKFEFAINLEMARALGIEVPPGLLSIADEVVE